MAWLKFSGKGYAYENIVILNPNNDLGIEITFSSNDVIIQGFEDIRVREGAVALKIDIPSSSPAHFGQKKTSSHPACYNSYTMCLGGLEICCNTQVTLGSCHGSWTC